MDERVGGNLKTRPQAAHHGVREYIRKRKRKLMQVTVTYAGWQMTTREERGLGVRKGIRKRERMQVTVTYPGWQMTMREGMGYAIAELGVNKQASN